MPKEAEVVTPLPAADPHEPPAPFVIPVPETFPQARARILKQGDTFGVFDQNGDAVSGHGSSQGLYHHDTRHLAELHLTINGARPVLLSSTLRDDNSVLTCDLANPDGVDSNGLVVLQHDLIHIRRSRFLWRGSCYERIAIRNFDTVSRRIQIGLTFAADFADLFEVRGTQRKHHGIHHPAVIDGSSVILSYTGLDQRTRTTTLRIDPRPAALTAGRATFDLDLAAHQTHLIFLEIMCGKDQVTPTISRPFLAALRDARRALRASTVRAASVATSNETFNEGARRSVADLNMLMTETPQGPYPYAGIPWFSTVFGRDALITALQTLWMDPQIARGVLGYLAANQADRSDAASDAEPGKILHEVRHGEMAELGEVPFRRYYGSVDATPLFVVLAGAYLKRTGDAVTIGRIWPNIEAALHWIENEGDRDGDGFVEYYRRTPDGLANQGWKDSHDSIFHSDGALAVGPIALVEVQGYVYGAWRAAAYIARELGRLPLAALYAGKAKSSAGTVRRSLLRREDGHLCTGPRWRQESLPGPGLQRRARAVHGHRPAGARQGGGRHADGQQLLHGLGHPHAGVERSALQSNELSQRLGLAARQLDDRFGLRTLWLSRRGGTHLQGSFHGIDLHRLAAPAGAFLRLCPPSGTGAHLLSRGLLATGMGSGRTIFADRVLPRPHLRR